MDAPKEGSKQVANLCPKRRQWCSTEKERLQGGLGAPGALQDPEGRAGAPASGLSLGKGKG